MIPKAITPSTRGFYGWFALAGVMLAQFFSLGTFFISFGVFLPVICAEFGWSRAVVSTGLTLGLLCFGLPSPLWGFLVARFGSRTILAVGNTLAALGLAGMSLVQEAWHVYILYSITGLGAGLGGMIACSTVANNWFIRKRSLAMGNITAAGSVSGFVFPPLVTVLISSIGWRISWLVLAGILFAGASLIGGVILVRNKPEDMGQAPDGIATEAFREVETLEYLPQTGKETAGGQTKQALRLPTTWLIIAFNAAFSFAMGTITTHHIAYLQDSGFSPMTAATTLSLVSGMGILGGPVFGTLALRLNIRYLASACFVIHLLALSILLATKNIALIYVYAVLFGISSGAIITAMPTFIGAYYGRARYSQVMGVVSPFQVAALAFGPTIAGAIYDATNTYTPAFALITALSLAGLVCAFLARPPKLPQAK